jgi:transcriptional regulator with XRE-family HTH domain
MDIKKTGNIIEELRKQKGYTQKELAEKLMVTDKDISRWETGKGLPEATILKRLSEILDISVGELLSDDRIDVDHKKDKTDEVILDSLKYSGQMFINMINFVLIVIGGVLILSPVFKGGGNGYCVLGIALVLLAILRMVFKRRWISIKNTNKAIYSFVLLCQLTVLVLEMLPDVVMLPFASGPNKWVTKTFSYFSLTPFGYAEYFPLLTGVLTITVIVFCIISLMKKKRAPKLQNAAFMCSIIAIVLSFLPLFKYGEKYMSVINYTISALILISIILQAVANRMKRGDG